MFLYFLLISSSFWIDSVYCGKEGDKYYPDDDSPEINEKAYLIRGESPYKITYRTPSPQNLSVPATVLKWTIAADDNCMPHVSCTVFSLAPPDSDDKKCRDQYLEVTDGIYGIKRYCGHNGPSDVAPSQSDGLRDLYITFKDKSREYNGRFTCTVECGDKALRNHLPKILTPNVDPKCLCGQKPPRNRIIGGHTSYFSEFPWLAAMVVRDTRQPYCIGSVINDRMILTAGHCFKGKFRKAINSQVVLNGYLMDPMPNINVIKTNVVYRLYDNDTLNKLDRDNGSYRFDVDRIWIHPHYASDTSDFDTAVMILSRPIDKEIFKEYSPICLPELSKDIDLYTGWKAHIAGWGLPGTKAKGTNTELKQITVNVFKNAECEKIFGDRLKSLKRQLCAAFPDASEDSCAGDSGGPLIIPYHPQVWYQIGIISWGDGCALVGHPGVYFRTTSTNQWIRHISNRKEAVWCDVPD